jgi:TonB family protein
MKSLAHERTTTDVLSTRSERVDAVVICSDDSLLIELGPLLGDRYRTHTVDSPVDISGRVPAQRWIGIVDVDCLEDARAAVARLEQQHHQCPLILVAARPEEWATSVSRGAALAAIRRQDVSGVRLTEALTIAEARLRESEPVRRTAEIPVSTHAPISPASGASGASRVSQMIIMVGAVLLLAAGGGVWWYHAHSQRALAQTASGGASPSAAPAPGAGTNEATAAPTRPQSVLELLSAARVAFHDQKLLLPRTDGAPRGDSALELYMQVLKQDPSNDEALDGVRRLFAVGRDRIQSDLSNGHLDDAARLVDLFSAAGVSADALQGLRQSIDVARPRWLAQRVQQTINAGDLKSAAQQLGQLTAAGVDPTTLATLRRSLEAKQLDQQLSAMASQVQAAIQAGNLLDPATDNARTRWLAMRTLSRANPLTVSTAHELQSALLQQVSTATHAGQFDQAQRDLSAAADLGAGSVVSEARQQLQNAMARAAQRASAAAAAARAAAAQAAAPAPAKPAAPAPASHEPTYIAARPVRPLNVEYPDGTAAQGYVIVEFTLEPDGSASDASVVQASPRGIFDRVALSAVLRGRYSTARLVDGEPLRARIMLRFKPN